MRRFFWLSHAARHLAAAQSRRHFQCRHAPGPTPTLRQAAAQMDSSESLDERLVVPEAVFAVSSGSDRQQS